jgi:serine protease Do
MTTREQIGAALAEVGARLRRGTVQVQDGARGGGSGIVWSGGTIVTNAHVVRGDRPRVTLWDGRTVAARVAAHDPRRDLAVLAVDATGLEPLPRGEAASLRTGDVVLAFGAPWGVPNVLAMGIVHAVSRDEGRLPRWVRADVRLAPGNSGGPLADAAGRVVGVNTLVMGGLGVAIASERVAEFLGERPATPTLGIAYRPVRVREGTAVRPGLLVLDVMHASAASDAAVWIGDVIVGIDGVRLAAAADLGRALARARAGDVVALELLRGGHLVTRPVTLREPAPAGARAA